MTPVEKRIRSHLKHGGRIWLFLDYDGTLADFAANPEVVTPDPDLIGLLEQLIQQPALRLTIVSGRRLAHIRTLIPIPGIWLAGTYGIELRTPSGESLNRLEYSFIRPILEEIKPAWQVILGDAPGFFLEDKGWTLAIHAKLADQGQANWMLPAARRAAKEIVSRSDFRLVGGHRFLEVSPRLADKGMTVEYLWEIDPWQGAMPIYVGDDDKDLLAFPVVEAYGGLALLVGDEHQTPNLDEGLESPGHVRAWLAETFLRPEEKRPKDRWK